MKASVVRSMFENPDHIEKFPSKKVESSLSLKKGLPDICRVSEGEI